MLALGLSVAIALPAAPPQAPPAPAPADLDAWRDHLAPSEQEERWRSIPWAATLGDGLAAAARTERPLLLWLMNGHPLGCT